MLTKSSGMIFSPIMFDKDDGASGAGSTTAVAPDAGAPEIGKSDTGGTPPVDDSFDSLPDKTKKELKDLRAEQASRRVRTKELEAENEELKKIKLERDAEKEKKLKEDGKLQEIIDEKDKKLEELEGADELNKKYEAVAKVDLDNELKGLPKSTVDLITNSGKSIPEQLEYAKKIKADTGVSSNSPGSERPGADAGTDADINAIIKKITDEKDYSKKNELLEQLKKTRPEVYKKLYS